ncbi:MAG: hypothetical protein IID44_11085 [Planctomycetes bacterium]|nr:hypothetical protein [Planctomycetota bacterium]
MDNYLWIALGCWLICSMTASKIGEQKQARESGFLLGVFLGPVGAILAGFLDNRPLCPRCGGRVNGTIETPFPVCQHCNIEYDSIIGFPSKLIATGPVDDNDKKPTGLVDDHDKKPGVLRFLRDG